MGARVGSSAVGRGEGTALLPVDLAATTSPAEAQSRRHNCFMVAVCCSGASLKSIILTKEVAEFGFDHDKKRNRL